MLPNTTVVHWNDRPADGAQYVYIGRSFGLGYFGNPFHVGRDGDRATVVAKFEAYFYDRLRTDLHFAFEVGRLSGKVLVCHCKPLACHGDVIAGFLNSLGQGSLESHKL